MLKKIIVTVVFVGLTGVLIWGGVNRTLARSAESHTSASSQASKNQGSDHEEGTEGLLENHGQGRGAGDSLSAPDHESDAGIGQGNGGGGQQGQGAGWGQGGGRQSLDADEVLALQMALEDEYHALAVYQAVLETFGAVQPFEEIAQSEQNHIDALLRHFDKHGIQVPENEWLGNVPVFESLQAACQAGVVAETENIALYDRLLAMTDDPGLIQVFSNLSRSSQESHLPEFQACE